MEKKSVKGVQSKNVGRDTKPVKNGKINNKTTAGNMKGAQNTPNMQKPIVKANSQDDLSTSTITLDNNNGDNQKDDAISCGNDRSGNGAIDKVVEGAKHDKNGSDRNLIESVLQSHEDNLLPPRSEKIGGAKSPVILRQIKSESKGGEKTRTLDIARGRREGVIPFQSVSSSLPSPQCVLNGVAENGNKSTSEVDEFPIKVSQVKELESLSKTEILNYLYGLTRNQSGTKSPCI